MVLLGVQNILLPNNKITFHLNFCESMRPSSDAKILYACEKYLR